MRSKIVEFQKIKVRNFLSYGDDPIEVEFKNGITFITGYNKDDDSYNGVGKTSLIVESLSFLLFGETYRDINQKLIKNKFGGKTCIVEGWLKVNDDELYIVRGLSPNKLILSVNGDSENYTKSIPETTKDIIDRIGVSKTIFTNTIVMTNRETMSFLNQKKEVKTKFIEGILGLEAFAEFLKFAKEESKEADDLKSKKHQESTLVERELENDKVYFQRQEDKMKNEIIRLENKVSELKKIQPIDNSDKISQLEKEKENLENSLPEKEEKSKRGFNKVLEFTSEINQKRKILTQLSGKLTSCPSCKRPFESHNQDEIDKEKDSLNKEIEALKIEEEKFSKAVNKLNNSISEIKQTCKKIFSEIQGLNIEQQKFIKSQSEIDFAINELQKAKNESNPFAEKIKQTEDKLQICKNDLEVLMKKSKLSNIVKEGASPTGVKSIVIKKIIDTLNNRINYYLMRLHSPFRVYFDEFFEESFKTVDGEDYSYGNLSGGEAKRVDFSMLFAFRDIRRLQSNVHVNLTVMDELFDSALCGKGMNDILELLKETNDECFMIVTHRSDNVEKSGCEIIDLIKENKITRLNT